MLNCGFDIICHGWNAWDSVGFNVQLMIIAGVLLITGGTVWNLGTIVKKVAGWPGVAGLGIILAGVATTLASTRPSPPVASPSPANVPKKPKVRTIFGAR